LCLTFTSFILDTIASHLLYIFCYDLKFSVLLNIFLLRFEEKSNQDDGLSIFTAISGIYTSSRNTANKKRGRGEMSEPVDDGTDDDVNDDNTIRQSSFTNASSSSCLPYAPSSSNQPKTAVKRKQNRFVCEHGKRKELCREGCGGSAYCAPHGVEKSRCKQCEGSGICPCGKNRSHCKKCGGSRYCIPHGKVKAYCKDCGGSALCEHENRKARCLICNDNTVVKS
jgi:hypothetical protein